MNEEQQIEEILMEASAYGLRFEVEKTAKSIIEDNSNIDTVLAYHMAYNEWIK